MEAAVSLTATSEEIGAILELARAAEGIDDVWEPSALDASKALNAGLTVEDIKTALEVITVIFKSGAALLTFLSALRAFSHSRRFVVGVSDAVSGIALGRIDATTTDSALDRMVPP